MEAINNNRNHAEPKMTTSTKESCLIEKLNGDFLSSTGSKEEEMRDF